MNGNKKQKATLIRRFIARFLCLTHLGISIYLLFATKFTRHLFFLPIIGISLIIFEIIIFSFLKFRFQYSFILLLIYSIFIISSIWYLELYRINYLISTKNQQASVEIFSVTYYADSPSKPTFFLYNKYVWSQVQIQVYIFLIVILKGLSEVKNHRLEMVIKTWATALDILDFIDLLSHPILYSDIRFVYITLSIWSTSCLQFIIDTSTIKKILIKRKYPRLSAIITDSLLSMLITDAPYLSTRLYAIVGVRRHDYTSYFLVLKNIFVIILETADVWSTFNTTKKKEKINPSACLNTY